MIIMACGGDKWSEGVFHCCVIGCFRKVLHYVGCSHLIFLLRSSAVSRLIILWFRPILWKKAVFAYRLMCPLRQGEQSERITRPSMPPKSHQPISIYWFFSCNDFSNVIFELFMWRGHLALHKAFSLNVIIWRWYSRNNARFIKADYL